MHVLPDKHPAPSPSPYHSAPLSACLPSPALPAVRIFSFNGGHSREVYHTKRMQRVFAVRFSGDGTYVFSGGWGGVQCSAVV